MLHVRWCMKLLGTHMKGKLQNKEMMACFVSLLPMLGPCEPSSKNNLQSCRPFIRFIGVAQQSMQWFQGHAIHNHVAMQNPLAICEALL